MCLLRENEERRSGRCWLSRWLPIAVILVILVWSYYLFVYQVCIRKVDNLIYMVLLLLGYHLLLVMFLWTWWKCICTSPVEIPNQWQISDEDVNRLQQNNGAEAEARILANAAKNLPIHMSTKEGLVRYCRFCWIIKPDRAHHCRSCRMCVMKRDHHCPWVKNCVHFHNFKYFILFLLYAELYCLYICVAMFYDFYLICQFKAESLRREHTWALAQHAAVFIINLFTLIMFTISVLNMARNRTTMESVHPPYFFVGGKNKNGFNLGFCANFREVLGDKWYLWLIPIQTLRGDGLTFPLAAESAKSARVQDRRGEEGLTRARYNMARLLGIHIANDIDYATD
ncbi:palmitoyltransferase ZDHHC15 [Drosophila kikkawai]|uniref:Palmitoyltransferase n=1 Tax=Drosophila kikkawai TaxID=30033 RepID=A0A6P4IDT8_DROKI|nr:palmitoyltransferase ZDHHC15 [Drosophila kikkawai]